MDPVGLFMLTVAMFLVACCVCFAGAACFHRYASPWRKRAIHDFFHRVQRSIIQSRGTLVIQDLAVLLKALFASVTLCILIPTGAKCKLSSFTYKASSDCSDGSTHTEYIR